jgi:hypothetical protein
MTIERTFHDIFKENITKPDRQNYLVKLCWTNSIGWKDLLYSKRVLTIGEADAFITICGPQSNLM